jgi:hypothetical protein
VDAPGRELVELHVLEPLKLKGATGSTVAPIAVR